MSRNSKHIEDIFSRAEEPQADDLLAYVDGRLSPEESRRMEKAMVDDPMLSDAVDGIEEVGTESFNDMLADLDRALEERLDTAPAGKEIKFAPREAAAPAARTSSGRFKYFAAAAAIALLVAVGFSLNWFQSATPESIALNNYQGISVPTNMRGDSGDQQSEYDRASTFYQQGKFQEAAELYGQLASPEAKLMAGHSYFQLKSYDRAATFFREAITLDQGNRQDAEYNLAMCYLLLEREKEARKLLRNIAGDTYHIYHKQAGDALEDLGK